MFELFKNVQKRSFRYSLIKKIEMFCKWILTFFNVGFHIQSMERIKNDVAATKKKRGKCAIEILWNGSNTIIAI